MQHPSAAKRVEIIGGATLYLGDCSEIIPQLGKVDAVITDPPYSQRTHAGHDSAAKNGSAEGKDGSNRISLGYHALTPEKVEHLARQYAIICTGWVVWMTDSDLALSVRQAMEATGRYAFAPLPFYQPGRSVRLTGDGPSSWTDWIVVSRTKAQLKWGTLPGGYIAGSGWNDKARMGGKPTLLMDALVADYSRPGHIVLDTHMGAGTTGVSCVKAGRKFIGCEIDPDAFDIACKRIKQASAQGSLFDANLQQAQAYEQKGLL